MVQRQCYGIDDDGQCEELTTQGALNITDGDPDLPAQSIVEDPGDRHAEGIEDAQDPTKPTCVTNQPVHHIACKPLQYQQPTRHSMNGHLPAHNCESQAEGFHSDPPV